MRPRFFPSLVNDRFGDPALHIDVLNERRALLFDLGDIAALSPRSILRLSDVFVSHAHIDHFIGFDRLLRLLVGRAARLRLHGPERFIDQVEAKLAAYTWNLVDRFAADLVFEVTELGRDAHGRRARFRLKNRFAREDAHAVSLPGGVLLDEPSLRVRAVTLDHRTPCLAFALDEPAHVNVWRNRLAELGLAVGPWLGALKRAIHERAPATTLLDVRLASGTTVEMPLGRLRTVVSITRGQKIAYVTDAAFDDANAQAIVDLTCGADILFIEAGFATADAAVAADRAHLTTAQAGDLARRAGVARVEPFHFSPRYAGEASRLEGEVRAAFEAPGAPAAPTGDREAGQRRSR